MCQSSAKPQGPVGGERSGRSSNTLPLQSAPPNAPPARGLACAVFHLRVQFMSWGSINFKYRGCAGRVLSGLAFSLFLLFFCRFALLLFCGWSGFFCGWGGCFRGWVVSGVLVFFVSLSRGRLFLFGFCPVPLGRVRGLCVRVVPRVRLVRAGGVACPRVGRHLPRGSRCRGLPPVRLLAVWAPGVLLVCGVVCGSRLRCLSWGVGRFGRCSRFRRSAFLVFLVFFNICRARLWHPPRHRGKFAALDGGKMVVEMT